MASLNVDVEADDASSKMRIASQLSISPLMSHVNYRLG